MKLSEVGETSQNHLGRLTAMDPNTVQGVVSRLEGRGLIERRRDPADRRRITLALSTEGAGLAKILISDGFTVSEETLAPLTEDESVRFLALLRKLV